MTIKISSEKTTSNYKPVGMIFFSSLSKENNVHRIEHPEGKMGLKTDPLQNREEQRKIHGGREITNKQDLEDVRIRET